MAQSTIRYFCRCVNEEYGLSDGAAAGVDGGCFSTSPFMSFTPVDDVCSTAPVISLLSCAGEGDCASGMGEMGPFPVKWSGWPACWLASSMFSGVRVSFDGFALALLRCSA